MFQTNIKIQKLILLMGMIFVFLIKAGSVLAFELKYPDIFGQHIDDTSSFPQYACYIFGLGINLALTIAVIVIVFGGIYYLVSFGAGKFTNEGKEWIKAGITGLLIVVCAFLIAHTINPNLTSCTPGVLSVINLIPAPVVGPGAPTVPVINYKEIPIGILTENLLTRTMDCYSFDQEGNPINGADITTDRDGTLPGPTYLQHDRADCLTLLADGAQEKGQIIAVLSDEITKLMNTCKCDGTKCSNDCICNPPTSCDPRTGAGTCNNGCASGGTCKQVSGNDCCEPGVKDKIEHGPIKVSLDLNSGEVEADSRLKNTAVPQYASASLIDTRVGSNIIVFGIQPNKTNAFSLAARAACRPPFQFCPENEYCLTGFCVPAPHCTGTGPSTCPTGLHCHSGLCKSSSSGIVTTPPCEGTGLSTCRFREPWAPDVWTDETSYHCNDGVCVTTGFEQCVGTGQGNCLAHQYCADGWCQDNVSCARAGGTCLFGQYCKDGACVDPCIGPGNCLAGQQCIGGRCVAACVGTGPSTCPPGQHCNGAGTCIGGCVGTGRSTCSVGQQCVSGVCVDGAACSVGFPCPYGQHCDYAAGICKDGNFCPSGSDLECLNGEKCDPITHICKCKTDVTEYKGLDEFRCDPNPIPGSFQSCDNDAIKLFVEKIVQVDGKDITTIDQSKWEKLNLIQQLAYFKAKIVEIKKKIKDDKDVLDQAKNALNKCYMAIPYVDLVKISEKTNKQNRVILTQKTFSDPETSEKIDVSKYCQGFNYNNSSCLKKCNDACPDASTQAINFYKLCTNPATQKACILTAYKNRPCIYGPNPAQTFGTCITSCQGDCKTACSNKYPACATSNEYQICIDQCNNNSKCVLDNADKCLLNANNFQQCAQNATGLGTQDYCISNGAYYCENGSNEFAGYQDCAEPSAQICSALNVVNCKVTAGCIWNGTVCAQDYSASFLYQNANSQKCANPYSPARAGSVCYKTPVVGEAASNCQDVCPETTKCPTSSNCPQCPCDRIDQNLKFLVPNQRITIGDLSESYSTQERSVKAYQIVGPQCNGYSYNDDPLTFYCEDNWWTNPNREGLNTTPIGTTRFCPSGQEVPLGMAVDEAEKWADNIVNNDTIEKDIKQVFDQMKKIGKANEPGNIIRDYCKCEAKREGGTNICGADRCTPQSALITGPDGVPLVGPDGRPIGYNCWCQTPVCAGPPCQQVADYLSELWNMYRKMKLDFIDLYTTALKEPRSDIMKKLTYSRQTTNNCSLSSSAYGVETRLLSCTRVEDELIAPINTGKIKYNDKTFESYCYGTALGQLVGKPLLDNWFCCEQWDNNSTPEQTNLYNN